MIRVEDLLFSEGCWDRGLPMSGEWDPLFDEDYLFDADIIDVRVDAVGGGAGVLFDTRLAEADLGGWMGVLVARGVRSVSWVVTRPQDGLRSWWLGAWRVGVVDGGLEVFAGAHGADLVLRADRLAFFGGDVPGFRDRQLDYPDHDRLGLRGQVAAWDLPFEPFFGSFRDAPDVDQVGADR